MLVVFDMFTAVAEAAALPAVSEFHTPIICPRKKYLSPFS
jgi:hypothetical protein